MVTAPPWYIVILSAVKSVADIQLETDGTVKASVFIFLQCLISDEAQYGFFLEQHTDSFIQYVYQIQSETLDR